MDLNKVTVSDVLDLIKSCDQRTLTFLEEDLNNKNIYGDVLKVELINKRHYNGMMIVDFVIPINFTYTNTPIAFHFVIRQSNEGDDVVLSYEDPVLISYDFVGIHNPYYILTECNIKTIGTVDEPVGLKLEPLPLQLSDSVATIYKQCKARTIDTMDFRMKMEELFGNDKWIDVYNIANFLPIEKWKCPHMKDRIEEYLKYLYHNDCQYINEMLLADNVHTTFGKFVLTKDLRLKYNLRDYKTIDERVNHLLTNKELQQEINELNKIKTNINKAQLEYDEQKNYLFGSIMSKYNITMRDLLIK